MAKSISLEHISQTEENYLKVIFSLSEKSDKPVSTNAISNGINTSAASVTDMLKRLSEKELIHYEKYKGVTLTESGDRIARLLVRKHRLWETFLVEKLDFNWDEVHEIAEQLEHIRSKDLVERLDAFLGHPKFDPHGDPIPDAQGNFAFRKQVLLSELLDEESGVVVGVKDHSAVFLQYLDQMQLNLGARVKVIERFDYDESVKILLNGTMEQVLSKKVCQNLYVKQ
jgi:DtxR family Mn-dependent transcriptional regulator